MGTERSDAFVFFGATGDLAFKQIFPALHGLIRDDGFDLPIIGVARSGDLDDPRVFLLRQRSTVLRIILVPAVFRQTTTNGAKR